jgi:hypothetical protein
LSMFCGVKNLVITIALLFSLAALAEEPVEFHALSQQWMDTLLEDNIEQVGALNLWVLKQQMDQLQVSTLVGDLPDFMGTRDSAYYTHEGKIHFRDDYPMEFLPALQLLATHEALGALGFQDDNYGVSILLQSLAESSKAKRQKLLTHPYIDSKFHAGKAFLKTGGGATGVGGGGDFMAAWVKYLVTQYVLKASHSPQHLMFLDQVRFEPYGYGNPKIQTTLSVDEQRQPHLGILGLMQHMFENDPTYRDNDELTFMVNVPTWNFQSHPEKIEAAVAELGNFFLEYMKGVRNEADADLQVFGLCGMSVMVVAKATLKSDLFKRSGGVEPFWQDFIKSCKEDFGYEAERY